MDRKVPLVCVAGILVVLILGMPPCFAEENASVRVKWIADGDTIILQDGRHVRYIGIDTPEIDHQNHKAAPFGYEARTVNRQLVEGWTLRLVFDWEKKDHYGRVLAYVYRRDGLFINAEIVRQGYAHVLYHPPNIDKIDALIAAQREAMQANRGVWQIIDKTQRTQQAFRGNRRSRRFHTRYCPKGKQISKGNLIWFENEWSAFWAGYAPARECVRLRTMP
ncbi:thermonuclease family protein [Desulfosarcina cetonica]|uniref:thermonuclease family protein n=1 Tax=Desulfosarcina cetonica TaxID=90730 RepID=UPI0006D1BAD5|nr:thermonuclease family protein [Desulfosarcina cetonica]